MFPLDEIKNLPLDTEKFTDLEVSTTFRNLNANQYYQSINTNRLIKIIGFTRTLDNNVIVYYQYIKKSDKTLYNKTSVLIGKFYNEFIEIFK